MSVRLYPTAIAPDVQPLQMKCDEGRLVMRDPEKLW